MSKGAKAVAPERNMGRLAQDSTHPQNRYMVSIQHGFGLPILKILQFSQFLQEFSRFSKVTRIQPFQHGSLYEGCLPLTHAIAQLVWIARNYKELQDKIKLVPVNLQTRPAWY